MVRRAQPAIIRVTPGDVGAYFQELPLAVPTKKLHLAAQRKFFDRLVNRHVIVINPAATVRAERYSVVEGKTPEIKPDQVAKLLTSIDVSTKVGLPIAAYSQSSSTLRPVRGRRQADAQKCQA